MRHTNLERAIMNNYKIIEIDLSESKIDKLCKLSGVMLERVIMKKVRTDRVNFVGVNMKQANLQYAQLKWVIVQVLDMTGTNLRDISAIGTVNFKETQLEGMKTHIAELSEVVLEVAK